MKKILVVDDSKTIRTLCEMIHKGLPDKVLTAANKAEADAIISAENPDVIFVDYTLPNVDSYEYVADLTSAGRNVVMMGGSYEAFDANLARSKGAIDVIIKPFRTEDFFNAENAAGSAPAVAPAPAAEPVAEAPVAASHTSVSAPAISAKRFNFPVGVSSSSNAAVSREEQPAPITSFTRKPDEATPVNPNSGIMPRPTTTSMITNVSALNAIPENSGEIDPAVKAEIVASVKQLLPAYVAHYVKKLIQQEIKPQLQTWVDARVEALLNQRK